MNVQPTLDMVRRVLLAIGLTLAVMVPFEVAVSTPNPASAGDPTTAIAKQKKKSKKKSKKRKDYNGPWDIVLVMTDDQPIDTIEQMPVLNRTMVNRGINYTNAIVPTSLCCPSRTSLVTGLLAPSTGIYSNRSNTGVGGYPMFEANGLGKKTIATALDAQGYSTAYFGKFLNEYGHLYKGYSPPGWDTWRVFTTRDSGRYRKYTLSDAVKPGRTTKTPIRESFKNEYSTDHIGGLVADHLRKPGKRPRLTIFAPYAPHAPYTAAPKYQGASDIPQTYWTPAVLEDDVSDKPEYIRTLPLQSTVEGKPPGENLRSQIDTLRSVDDQVGEFVQAVKESGRLDRTLFIYISDNGYLHGEHRLEGKGSPHYKSTNVPMVVRWGNQSRQSVDNTLTLANVDIAATILQAAGLPNDTQGSNLLDPTRNAQGAQLVGTEAATRFLRPPFCAWRDPDELFVRYGTGEEEYYDYRVDPHELTNAVNDPRFADRVAAMRDLARRACTPTPPGYGPTFDEPDWLPVRKNPNPEPGDSVDDEDWASSGGPE